MRADWDLQGYSAAGSIYSNIDDLAKWMNLQFMTTPGETPVILNPFVLEEMHTVQVLQNPDGPSKTGTGLVWYTERAGNFSQTGHNGATGGYKAYFAFDKKSEVGVIVMASNGQSPTTAFGKNLLKEVQQAIANEKAKPFVAIADKLIPWLALENITDFREIFDQGLFDYIGSDAAWASVLGPVVTQYGKPTEVLSIVPKSKSSALVTYKTPNGKMNYSISLSTTEPGKISGILVEGFEE